MFHRSGHYLYAISYTTPGSGSRGTSSTPGHASFLDQMHVLSPQTVLSLLRTDPGKTAAYYAKRYFDQDSPAQVNSILWKDLKKHGQVKLERDFYENALWWPETAPLSTNQAGAYAPTSPDRRGRGRGDGGGRGRGGRRGRGRGRGRAAWSDARHEDHIVIPAVVDKPMAHTYEDGITAALQDRVLGDAEDRLSEEVADEMNNVIGELGSRADRLSLSADDVAASLLDEENTDETQTAAQHQNKKKELWKDVLMDVLQVLEVHADAQLDKHSS
eukprot:PhM_4_TR17796/c0_g1_i1/m.46607